MKYAVKNLDEVRERIEGFGFPFIGVGEIDLFPTYTPASSGHRSACQFFQFNVKVAVFGREYERLHNNVISKKTDWILVGARNEPDETGLYHALTYSEARVLYKRDIAATIDQKTSIYLNFESLLFHPKLQIITYRKNRRAFSRTANKIVIKDKELTRFAFQCCQGDMPAGIFLDAVKEKLPDLVPND